MSYTFYNTDIYDPNIINHIYSYIKKRDMDQKSPTSDIIKQVFIIREHLQTNHLTIKKILYSLFFSSLPSAWLINIYNESDWDEHVRGNINP